MRKEMIGEEMLPMTDVEQRAAAKQFAKDWKGRGYEKGDCQPFWMALLGKVFGVPEPEKFIQFENAVRLEHTSFIDARIPSTKTLIEQKGVDVDLNAPQRQSDGAMLTPMEQAKRYATASDMPLSERPRFIVACNFATFQIYDAETLKTETVQLADLPKEYYRLSFLSSAENVHLQREKEISVAAGNIVAKLYDGLLKLYRNPEAPETLKSLNALCVRFVFCLYAEDAGIFGLRNQFHDYLERFPARDIRAALIMLFRVLDTKLENRDPYMDKDLAAFPYVNGGLFRDESIEIPNFTDEIKSLLLDRASEDIDWSGISPTIFGAVFESTLNPETRRSGGMHYTSIENIHKVIDPLFLDSLKAELAEIKEERVFKTRKRRLEAFQDKLAGLTFLDPACGSGNFLTETYLSLRRLENEALVSALNNNQSLMDLGDVTYIKVSIKQFYGIEINDFAVTVAKTALWIAESQMMKASAHIGRKNFDFLPLKSYANIVEGNALSVDWESVITKDRLSYIIGNPPFIGASKMTKEQKAEAVAIFGEGKRVNSIDYVGAWYYKTAQLIQNSNIRAAFVSTNSITQGEQVSPLWKKLLEQYQVHIDFAYRTFKWSNEAKEKAGVYCVIIGFSVAESPAEKYIFSSSGERRVANNINPYLVDSVNVLVESRGTPLCSAPRMTSGNKPADGGNLILSEEEKDAILAKDSNLSICIRRYVSSKDFINNDEKRYCLWLKDVSPTIYRKNSDIMQRLNAVREMRLASSAAPTHALADRPYLFFSAPQTDSNYLCIPEVSSERRVYIPIGFMDKSVIASNKLLIIPNATLFHFGVLTSNVHLAWTGTVSGRLGIGYQYSGATVYNNFPWPNPSDEQMDKIEDTAQEILDARAKYQTSSFADLYDPLTMPPELRKAHQANDSAVMKAYGYSYDMTEPQIVADLMKRYQALVRSENLPI